MSQSIMNRTRLAILLLCVLASALLVFCGGSPATPLAHGYTLRGEHIYFEGGGSTGYFGGKRIDGPSNFNIDGFEDALGRKLTVCRDPDAATFEPLSEEYSRDKNAVYYKWISLDRFLVVELSNADVATFRAMSYMFAADANTIWYMDQPIIGSEPASFVILEGQTAKDRHRVYVGRNPIAQLDASTFRHLGSAYFVDKNGVYWGTEPVIGADPATFEVLDGSFVAKDANSVYRSGQVMIGADVATINLLLDDPYGYQITSDRNGVYASGLKFLHADPSDFTVRDNRAAVGGRYLFVIDTYYSTPITAFRENGALIAETILYDRTTKQPLATARAEVTERGLTNTRLSPPPGASATGSVPAGQLQIFERPGLAATLLEKAEAHLPE